MEDSRIVDLYWQRDEQAIVESDAKYGRYCLQISMNILDNHEDAEECVNDTYNRAWGAMPTDRPTKLGAYLAKICRNLSIDRYKANHAAKREESLFLVSLDELNECIPAEGFRPDVDIALESERIGLYINDFLRRQRTEVREVFICRYFDSETIDGIARRFGMSESKVKSILHRTRARLRKHLENEGVSL